MKKEILEILKTLNDNGYEAYIVGGFVRDYLLNIKSLDYDIITNCLPLDVAKLFPNADTTFSKYGAIKLKIDGLAVDITTYRKDTYKDGRLIGVDFVSTLKEDLMRRDFKMNTLCMSADGKIIDLLDGLKDINRKEINLIRDANQEFKEDPSRMLRALRFMSELSFNLSEEIKDYILSHKEELATIPEHKLNAELSRLYKMGKTKQFKDFIKKYELEYLLNKIPYKSDNND